ncbi:MAG: N-acetyltransferase family protein [Methanoregula sp.]
MNPIMTGTVTLREAKDNDRNEILDIFNHYATTGFAAYPDGPVPPQIFPLLREGAISFCVMECENEIIGFGILKSFFPFPAFRHTGMITYFIHPEYTGQGLGRQMLDRLTQDAHTAGITTLLANISSKNEGSIRFHERNGFAHAGRLHAVGEKFGELFDLVWMEKKI